MKSDWKTAEYLQKHPMGYLPALEDGDFHLSESSAIAEYGESSCSLPQPLSPVPVCPDETIVIPV